MDEQHGGREKHDEGIEHEKDFRFTARFRAGREPDYRGMAPEIPSRRKVTGPDRRALLAWAGRARKRRLPQRRVPMKKSASAVWQGGLKDGKGTISTESG